MTPSTPSFYEFFAGAGMARAGLGKNWQCLFSNDFDRKKASTYRRNWGDTEFVCDDIRNIETDILPGSPDLAWASFPCQDLSLAGGGAGLRGERSGAFWPFWHLMTRLAERGNLPPLIVLENVCGTLTSHKGKDFSAICRTLQKSGYRFGALVIDASLFVPQSRPRLFVIGVHEKEPIPDSLISDVPTNTFHSRALKAAHQKLSPAIRADWVWWNISAPPLRTIGLSSIIEDSPSSVSWHTPAETRKLLAMMSEVNLKKVREAKRTGHRVVGTVYKRTRCNDVGQKVQRAEVRFDGISGCLRTPAGGSSRQIILVVEGRRVRSRLISSRETARLMGLPDGYVLPASYNESYHLTGDGVVVPVVRFLAKSILEPMVAHIAKARAAT